MDFKGKDFLKLLDFTPDEITALLDLAERIIVLDGGRIAADGPKDKILAALKEGSIGRAY